MTHTFCNLLPLLAVINLLKLFPPQPSLTDMNCVVSTCKIFFDVNIYKLRWKGPS